MVNIKEIMRSSAAEYLTYVTAVGAVKDSVEMRYEDENVWLTQKMMAELYDVDIRTISEHIQKVLLDGELQEYRTIRNFRIVQKEGNREVSRNVKHYNLQMCIAVGFKVNNERAVQFRKWATLIVKDYTIQGRVMDDDRLKNGGTILTKDYGKISAEIAKLHAETKFEKYRVIQDGLYESDFDKFMLLEEMAVRYE